MAAGKKVPPSKTKAGSRRSPARRPPLDLAGIVAEYIAEVRPAACERLAFYATQQSLADALEVVARWRGLDGDCEPHQRWLSPTAKAAAADAIRGLALKDAQTFLEVYRRVVEALGMIRGIGPRTLYDVAFRLGAVLGLPPERVYLHQGSLVGAELLGIQTLERSLPLSAFPAELRRLHAWEIENFLCVMRDALSKLGSPAKCA